MTGLEALLAGSWSIGAYLPTTALVYSPEKETAHTALSVTAAGVILGYSFLPSVQLFGEYEFDYSLASRNIFLSGLDGGARFYLLGGAATARSNIFATSFESPENSVAFSVIGLQRNFDIGEKTTTIGNGVTVSKPYDSAGHYFAVGASLAYEKVVFSEHTRFVLEGLAAQSLSVSTAIKFLQVQGRIGLVYQM